MTAIPISVYLVALKFSGIPYSYKTVVCLHSTLVHFLLFFIVFLLSLVLKRRQGVAFRNLWTISTMWTPTRSIAIPQRKEKVYSSQFYFDCKQMPEKGKKDVRRRPFTLCCCCCCCYSCGCCCCCYSCGCCCCCCCCELEVITINCTLVFFVFLIIDEFKCRYFEGCSVLASHINREESDCLK